MALNTKIINFTQPAFNFYSQYSLASNGSFIATSNLSFYFNIPASYNFSSIFYTCPSGRIAKIIPLSSSITYNSFVSYSNKLTVAFDILHSFSNINVSSSGVSASSFDIQKISLFRVGPPTYQTNASINMSLLQSFTINNNESTLNNMNWFAPYFLSVLSGSTFEDSWINSSMLPASPLVKSTGFSSSSVLTIPGTSPWSGIGNNASINLSPGISLESSFFLGSGDSLVYYLSYINAVNSGSGALGYVVLASAGGGSISFSFVLGISASFQLAYPFASFLVIEESVS